MENIDLKKLRILIDEAITYADWDQAHKLIDQGLEVADKKEFLSEKMYFTAQLDIIEENFEEAIRNLDLAIKYNPSDGAAYNDRALCMIELGKLEVAVKYFDEGIKVEPDFASIHHNKGWFLNKTGEHNAALKCFQDALNLDFHRSVTYENLANCFLELKRIPEAIDAYQKTIACLDEDRVEIKKQIESFIEVLEKLEEKI